MKKFNSLIASEDHRVYIPHTDCQGMSCRNHSHEYNTNHHGTANRDTRAVVRFMGEILKPTTHRSKNPSTWEF